MDDNKFFEKLFWAFINQQVAVWVVCYWILGWRP